MGQKVHPLGFRIGISKNHNSVWYSKSKEAYTNNLMQDLIIRDFINKNLSDTSISNIEIFRKIDSVFNRVSVNVHVVKPGLVLGVNSSKLYELRDKLCLLLQKTSSDESVSHEVTINLVEVVNPDTNSKLLASLIRQQLEKRVPFRRAMKSAIQKAQKSGVKGIKVQISGRLNGAEIARTEWIREGQVPLHTLRANIDYFSEKAQTLYGILGIKVWVYLV